MRLERLGGLQVRLTGGTDGQGGGEGPVVVLLHGFGAPGDDLVPLWQALDAPQGTRFVFPEGPLALSMGFGQSRAWWMLDLDKLNRDLAAGRPRDASRETPKGLAEARNQVTALLDDVTRRLGADPKRTLLGGFSQGAMLSCDVALRTARPLAGLVLLSGTLLAKEEWVPLMPKRKGLRVLQSHGSKDPLLPLFLAEQLRDYLTQAGLAVQWVGFRGGHEIPDAVLAKLGPFLRETLAPR
ncbi:MAG: esterase [Nitrospira sp.]|nr:esterase [Nitrospira sp.]